MGPLTKISKRKSKKEGLELALVPDGSIPLRFLGHLARVRLDCCVPSSCWDQGAPKARKELGRQRAGGIGHTIRNLWLVSIDIVFENATSIAISKNNLQGLLVILLHDLLVFVGLGMERGYLILSCPNL